MPQKLDVRSRWSIAMFAAAMGERRGAALRALKAHNVPIQQSTKRGKRWVYLFDIQRNWPEGWISMLEAAGLREKKKTCEGTDP